MRRIMRKFALAVTVALAGTFVASCDSAERLAAPQSELTPQYTPGGPNSGRMSRVTFLQPAVTIDGVKEFVVDVSASGKFVALEDGTNYVRLYVQPGTVKKNTTFKIQVQTEAATDATPAHIRIDLTATSAGSAVVNDVGDAGFRKPVYLMVNLGALDLSGIPANEWSARLRIAEALDDGSFVTAPSFVHDGWLWAQLKHFSSWVPIAN